MTIQFPIVPLSDILYLFNDQVDVDSASSYPIAGVYSFGRGLFERQSLTGLETTYKFLHRLHRDDFVLSQLKGWEGALARVSTSFEGWFLSPQFQTFRVVPEKMEVRYLEWYCKQSIVWEELRNKSRGMGARRDTISPNQFLSLAIPLPPLEEQRRIVARVEELVARIEEARGVRREAVEDTENVMFSAMYNLFKSINKQYMFNASSLNRVTKIYGGGTPSKANYEFWQGTIPWVSPKDMKTSDIYDSEDHISELAVQTGTSTLIPQNSVLVVVRSGILRRTLPIAINRVPVTINQDMKALVPSEALSSDFLAWWFRSKEELFLEHVKGGTTVQSLIWNEVSKTNICIPPHSVQQQVVSYLEKIQAKVDTLKCYQTETTAELNALLPSILDKAFKGEL